MAKPAETGLWDLSVDVRSIVTCRAKMDAKILNAKEPAH